MRDELLPCPFCGASAGVGVDHYDESHCVDCEACGAQGPSEHNEPEAVAAWNRHALAQDAPSAEQLAAAEQRGRELQQAEDKARARELSDAAARHRQEFEDSQAFPLGDERIEARLLQAHPPEPAQHRSAKEKLADPEFQARMEAARAETEPVIRPMLEALERSQQITAEDLALRVTAAEPAQQHGELRGTPVRGPLGEDLIGVSRDDFDRACAALSSAPPSFETDCCRGANPACASGCIVEKARSRIISAAPPEPAQQHGDRELAQEIVEYAVPRLQAVAIACNSALPNSARVVREIADMLRDFRTRPTAAPPPAAVAADDVVREVMDALSDLAHPPSEAERESIEHAIRGAFVAAGTHLARQSQENG